MKYGSATDDSGFTLIEVIVAIVLVASLSGIMIVFLSDSLVKSSQSIGRLKKVAALNIVMANITQYYNKYPKWRSVTTYAPGNFVVPTVRNGSYYKCTVGGTSNLSDPNSWPLILGDTMTDSTITWQNFGQLPTLNEVLTSIGLEGSNQNNTYGTYHVEKNRCVNFLVSDSEQDEPSCNSKILKVTIRSDQGEALTALFLF
jgi:prepilin-type N-terminal cleavage/methylation domain-containing protein